MNLVKELFGGVDKLLGIFNLGRLVFYTAAGFLAVYPAFAALEILACPLRGHPLAELVRWSPNGSFDRIGFAAIVMGFLVASYGFVQFVAPAGDAVKARVAQVPIDRSSYPFRYCQLHRGDAKVDYEGWIIGEYFRFVEIVAYVPLGLIAGLAVTLGYTAVYALLWAAEGRYGPAPGVPLRDFIATAAVFAFTAAIAWPRFWIPLVVERVIEIHHAAKIGLLAALDEEKWNSTDQPVKQAAKEGNPGRRDA